jgi:hypothetical protein
VTVAAPAKSSLSSVAEAKTEDEDAVMEEAQPSQPVHYDEKWFWSKMLRSQAKECAEFGVEQQNIRTRHKKTP